MARKTGLAKPSRKEKPPEKDRPSSRFLAAVKRGEEAREQSAILDRIRQDVVDGSMTLKEAAELERVIFPPETVSYPPTDRPEPWSSKEANPIEDVKKMMERMREDVASGGSLPVPLPKFAEAGDIGRYGTITKSGTAGGGGGGLTGAAGTAGGGKIAAGAITAEKITTGTVDERLSMGEHTPTRTRVFINGKEQQDGELTIQRVADPAETRVNIEVPGWDPEPDPNKRAIRVLTDGLDKAEDAAEIMVKALMRICTPGTGSHTAKSGRYAREILLQLAMEGLLNHEDVPEDPDEGIPF